MSDFFSGLFGLIVFFAAIFALLKGSNTAAQIRALRSEVDELREYIHRLHRYLEMRAKSEQGPAPAAQPAETVPSAQSAESLPPEQPAESAPPPRTAVAEQSAPAAAAVRPAPAVAPTRPVPVREPSAAPAPGRPAFAEVDATSETEPEAARPAGLEETLGSRLPVWVGAVALTLAGIFLVQHGIEQGWLSPARRVGLAIGFGLALLGLGERFRAGSPRIGSALVAAGVADLYGALLAGVRLYHLIPPALGFALMAGNTALAVGLALRYGPLPAVIGLLGGFFTPALIDPGDPSRTGSLVYLFLLEVGLVAVARRRRWPALAGGALAGVLLWVASSLSPAAVRFGSHELSLLLFGSFVLFTLWAGGGRAGAAQREDDAPQGLLLASGIGALFLQALLVRRSGFDLPEWGFLGLLLAGSMVLAAWREAGHFALAVAGPAAAGAALFVWGNRMPPAEMNRFLAVDTVFGLLVAAIALGAARRSERPGRWTALTGAASVAALLLAVSFARPIGDGRLATAAVAVAAGLAAAAALLPGRTIRNERAASVPEDARIPLATAASVAFAIALQLALEREWLSIGFAGFAAALVLTAGPLRLPVLARLGLAAFAVAVVRLALNPAVLRYPIGESPVAGWMLWGYGLPILCGFGTAWHLRRTSADELERWFEGGAIVLAAAGLTLQAWQIALPGEPALALATGGLTAWAWQTTAWLVLAVVLLAAARASRHPVRLAGARILALLGGLSALVAHGLVYNPAWSPQPVGETPIFNRLLFFYGVPLLLLLAVARELARAGSSLASGVARTASALLGFALVTLEVRQMFRGTDLSAGAGSAAENLAYSATWALLGTLLLLIGLARRSRGLRLAALALLLVTTLKVFLYDASGLTGLYRVLSFLGLGATLLLLAWLYQRFVFRRDPADGSGT